ncbi:hypothetical protein Chor_000946, partial [Crotalus horridus]
MKLHQILTVRIAGGGYLYSNNLMSVMLGQVSSCKPLPFIVTLCNFYRYACEMTCKKRDDYLEWPEYFMAVAFLSAQRSKDPNSQVGACIVNSENKIVGIGYNGMPNGCSDDLLPWTRTADNKLNTKYPYVCHAELNAIMNKNSADVKGCSIYVALFPCNECAKLIIQAGKKKGL